VQRRRPHIAHQLIRAAPLVTLLGLVDTETRHESFAMEHLPFPR
jgi:hypothetical protein